VHSQSKATKYLKDLKCGCRESSELVDKMEKLKNDLRSTKLLPFSALESIIRSSHSALHAEFESHESRRRPGLEFQDERDILLIWLSVTASTPQSLLPMRLRQRQAGGEYNSFEPLAGSESDGDAEAEDWSDEVEEDATAELSQLNWADQEADTDTECDSEVKGTCSAADQQIGI
jgi:hypothetical protein